MLKSEIEVGRFYRARVSGIPVIVRVDLIGTRTDRYHQGRTIYHVTNLRTGRKLTFYSTRKFRLEVNREGRPV